ncbi:PulJ/GspJ family protein [Paenibacillus aestuarii]|uniref:Type II secretion system protein J n=1 Tax=Paenibacillus aestuarii TaxID=516965 RepID=A0ABW0KKH4_9BACL|nr:prepilin-type N-terminal cleavage/methylation domain-containing protein [Paenibacillus aestuarii]
MKNGKSREAGFTLIEVLASVVILSIVSIAMFAFFNNAMSYNKGNQNKTVMINLARNTLFYMEKQSFDELDTYFGSHDQITLDDCDSNMGCSLGNALPSMKSSIYNVFHAEINGIKYISTVTYQRSLVDGDGKWTYLLPIKVTVKEEDAPSSKNGKRYEADVEGYVVDEAIR